MTSPVEQPAGWVTAEQAQQMVADALSQHQTTAAGSITAEQAQAMIDQALARQAEQYNVQIQQMAESLRGSVVTYIAEHAGGKGTEIAPTWSQWEQTRAKAEAEAAKEAATA